MARMFALLLLFFGLMSSSALRAQVSADARRPMVAMGYATATAAQPELGQGRQLGTSGGVILQRSRLLAVDFRGVMLNARVPVHTYIAEAGARVAPGFSRRWQPYGGFLAGYGHSEYRVLGKKTLDRGFGFAWTGDLGLDLHLKYGLAWRVAEYSYNHISAGPGVSPTMLSTGLVFRYKAPSSVGQTM